MTPPNRTGGAGSLGGASTADIRPGPPVPPAGAGPATTAPAGPQTTVGAAVPDHAAPAVFHGRWASALSGRRAHLVPDGAPQGVHFGRPTGLTVDGWDALIDPRGLKEAAAKDMPECLWCTTMLRHMGANVELVSP